MKAAATIAAVRLYWGIHLLKDRHEILLWSVAWASCHLLILDGFL